jgi:hypothetical protein
MQVREGKSCKAGPDEEKEIGSGATKTRHQCCEQLNSQW